MPMPKFNQEIKNIVREEMGNKRPGCEGMIVRFNPTDRSVDVVVNSVNSDRAGEYLRGAPLPINLGVQGLDPVVGQYCFITFKDGNPKAPFVSAIYPTDYAKVEKLYHEKVFPVIPRFTNRF